MNNTKKAGLYIHVPFCLKKCNYCDFYSLSTSPELMERYVSALISQLKEKAEIYSDYTIDTVYIGGGTPTCLGKLLIKIVTAVYKYFNVESYAEFTVETNPGTSKADELIELYVAGVNRLSIGLQSANEDELKLLGRIHSLADYEDTLKNARLAGFENISTDIMFSLPFQTPEKLENTLSYVINSGVEHISAYSLKIEKATPFYSMQKDFILPDEDLDADMYLKICENLEKSGYSHYEISNFAKPGHLSRHNLRYWKCDEYIGFGPAAHSYIGGVRYGYTRNICDYLKVYETKKLCESDIISERSTVTPLEDIRERLMLGLRLKEGVNNSVLEKIAPLYQIHKKIVPLTDSGLIKIKDDGISLTNSGMYVSNAIISFISEISEK